MKKEQMEQHIKNAISDITPNILERVSYIPVDKINELEMPEETKRFGGFLRNRVIYSMAAICAVCLMAVIGLNLMNSRIVTTIDIDVNPSIKITADKTERVIDVIPSNKDGEMIIDNMNLQNVDLNVAVNAIIGSMVKHGYLNEAKNAILISVDNKDKAKAELIRTHLTEDVSISLAQSNIKATIYNQEVTNDKSLKEISEKYNISIGKASFLTTLIKSSGSLTYEELVPLTMEELTELIIQKNINLHGVIDYEEDESVKENIEDAIEDIEEDTIEGKTFKDDDSDDDDSEDDDSDDDSDDDDSEDVNSKGVNAKGVNAKDVNSKGVNAKDVNAKGVNAKDVNAKGVNAKDVNSKDVNAKGVNAKDVNAKDVNSKDVNAKDVNSKGNDSKDVNSRDDDDSNDDDSNDDDSRDDDSGDDDSNDDDSNDDDSEDDD